jgi:hypothetical protein
MLPASTKAGEIHIAIAYQSDGRKLGKGECSGRRQATYTLASSADASFYIKQARRTALTYPFGSVVLTCPLDLWEAEAEEREEPQPL